MFLIGYVSGYGVNYNTITGALWNQKPNSLRYQDNSMPRCFFKGPLGILFERNLCWLLPFQKPFQSMTFPFLGKLPDAFLCSHKGKHPPFLGNIPSYVFSGFPKWGMWETSHIEFPCLGKGGKCGGVQPCG